MFWMARFEFSEFDPFEMVAIGLPSLKLTAKAPENRGPLELWRFRAWKPPFLGANS